GRVQRAHLDFARDAFAERPRKAPGPLQRLLAVAHVDQRVAGDEFFRLRERAVNDAPLVAFVADAPALAGGLQARGVQQDTGLRELLVVDAHFVEDLLKACGRDARFGFSSRLDQDHEFHRGSFRAVIPARRRTPARIDTSAYL